MTTTLTAHEPGDLVAHLPYRLGFHPHDSVVLAGLAPAGRPGRTVCGLVVRVDTADLAGEDGPELARSIGHHLRRDGAVEVLAVVYADGDRAGLRANHSVRAARRALAAGIPWAESVTQPWYVGSTGFGHLDPCPCCPPAGRPRSELTGSAVSAGMVVAGFSAAPSRAHLAVARSRQAGRRAEAAEAARAARGEYRAARRASDRVGSAPRGASFGPAAVQATILDGTASPLGRWRRRAADAWDDALAAAQPVPAAELGRLLVALEDRTVRDAALARALLAADRTADLLPAEAVATAFTTELPPHPEVVGPVERLATAVAAHAPDGEAGPALGLLAFLAWWDADGARADVLARQALEEQPGHRLAELVLRALGSAVPPGWYRPHAPGRPAG